MSSTPDEKKNSPVATYSDRAKLEHPCLRQVIPKYITGKRKSKVKMEKTENEKKI